ncbi:hypothetical protein [Planotetraspora kaengkrachanensis]|uniref:DUF3558 domain-containing protein n=1 Tax=Planotetraspora kaengkrachanensis TaxID=575193 RepID=A0A8J3LUI5_9ACTN|nr:hypothetical protein [Planotetraspora kaengkrachanensis]GIG78059.1 hypothetical protein Pka01_11860 [Planotetraspora kaengkrachanensis]
MRHSVSKMVIAVVAGAFLAGCGSTGDTSGDGGGSGGGATKGAATAAAKPSGGCPLTAESLSKTTSLTWELRETEENHPLETAESIKATVCLFTAADAPQQGSDPLALRADVVTGGDVATVRQAFTDSCSGFGGKERESGKGVVCERNKVVVEGLVEGGGRLVNVYLVNADTPTATKLTPVFDQILASVS